jgi:hypothetical protein
MNAKALKRLGQLFALLGSNQAGERENARKKLDELLRRHGKTWNDVPELLSQLHTGKHPSGPAPDPRDEAPAGEAPTGVTVADLAHHVIKQYVSLKPHELVAAALWAVHSHVYDRFMVTPRLVLTSPVRSCGKTTLLDVLSQLVVRPAKTDHVTAAAIYHLVDRDRSTLLIDEADNLELAVRAVIRSILNSGHRYGGAVTRLLRNQPTRLSTFAPAALAAIRSLPLPLMSRSIVIHMERASSTENLLRFDRNDTDDIDTAYRFIRLWGLSAELNTDPPMPSELRGRAADNWRPLVAVADACSSHWGTRAREAAIAMSGDHHDEDPGVELLSDIRAVFDTRKIERIPSSDLTTALVAIDEAQWHEWRGAHGDQQPRKLTQMTLAGLLKPFRIRPKTMWSDGKGSRSFRGYQRTMFAAAWSAYCDGEDVKPSTAGNVRHLGAA